MTVLSVQCLDVIMHGENSEALILKHKEAKIIEMLALDERKM